MAGFVRAVPPEFVSAAKTRLFLGIRFAASFFLQDYRCVVCSKDSGRSPVCVECREKYFSVVEPVSSFCSVCGKRLVSEEGTCMECRESPLLMHADSVYSLYSYRLWNETLLCRWKITGDRGISFFFAERLSARLKVLFGSEKMPVIVPVPPRPGKIKKKGWDQVDELVSLLHVFYGFQVRYILERKSGTQQKTLDRNERLDTIGKGYSVRKDVRRLPQKVCLIDDVLTTGATAESCAIKLKAAGVQKVFVLTLFSVD